ncbi:MAG TPA: DUF2019 domain-containing protein [Stellaceae bacterium]|nr:DUF2019 domain-containing protein [Stellaceae bacterium]
MSDVQIETLLTEQLIERYVKVSLEQFDATQIDDDETYNELFDEISAISKVLRDRGGDAHRALLPLLDHENAQVRFNAAHDLLTIEPQRARAALEWVARWGPGPQRGSAGMSLRSLDSGQYKPT